MAPSLKAKHAIAQENWIMCLFAYLSAIFILFLQITQIFSISIFPFIPFLASLSLKKPLPYALWLSSLGLLPLEIFSSDPFGIYSLSGLITTLIGYRLRNVFSSESWIQFSFLAAVLSFIQTTLIILFLFLFDRRIPFQGKWWFVDLPLLSILDAGFAALWFIGPLAVYQFIHKNWDLYWLKRQI